MDYAACNVIYVDRNARGRRLVKRGDATMALMKSSSTLPAATSPPSRDPSAERHVYDNVEVLLENFSSGQSVPSFRELQGKEKSQC